MIEPIKQAGLIASLLFAPQPAILNDIVQMTAPSTTYNTTVSETTAPKKRLLQTKGVVGT